MADSDLCQPFAYPDQLGGSSHLTNLGKGGRLLDLNSTEEDLRYS